MATSVVEILPGSTDDFFVALLGKVRICNHWRRKDENWRRLVAVSRKKGLTFVARYHEILTFHTASLIDAVQSSQLKEVPVRPPSSFSVEVGARVTILSVGVDEKFLVAAEDSCHVNIYRIRSMMEATGKVKRVELEARCVAVMWIDAKSFVVLMANHKAVEVDVDGNVKDWSVTEPLVAMDVMESMAAWVTVDDPSVLNFGGRAAIDLTSAQRFCPNEDDQLIVNAVKILSSSRVMVTAVSVNGNGKRTNTAVGIVAWTSPTFDVCVYPEDMELFLPPQVEKSDPCFSQTLSGVWIDKWNVWLTGCGEDTTAPLRLMLDDDSAVEFTIPDESFVWPVAEKSMEDCLMLGMGWDTSSRLRMASEFGTGELRMCHVVVAASEDGLLVISALGKEMEDVEFSVCGESTESESEEAVEVPQLEEQSRNEALPDETQTTVKSAAVKEELPDEASVNVEVMTSEKPEPADVKDKTSVNVEVKASEQPESADVKDQTSVEVEVKALEQPETVGAKDDSPVKVEFKISEQPGAVEVKNQVSVKVELKATDEPEVETDEPSVKVEVKASELSGEKDMKEEQGQSETADDESDVDQSADVVESKREALIPVQVPVVEDRSEEDDSEIQEFPAPQPPKAALTEETDTDEEKAESTDKKKPEDVVKHAVAVTRDHRLKQEERKETKPSEAELEATLQRAARLKAAEREAQALQAKLRAVEREEQTFQATIHQFNDDASTHFHQFNAIIRLAELTKLTKMQAIDVAMQARQAVGVIEKNAVAEDVQQRVHLIKRLQEGVAMVQRITQCFQFNLSQSDAAPGGLEWDVGASMDSLKALKLHLQRSVSPQGASSALPSRSQVEECVKRVIEAPSLPDNPVHSIKHIFAAVNPEPIVTKVPDSFGSESSRSEGRIWKQVVGEENWNVCRAKTDRLQLPEEGGTSFVLRKTDASGCDCEWIPEQEMSDLTLSDDEKSFGTAEGDSDELVLCSEEEIEEIMKATSLKEKEDQSSLEQRPPRNTPPCPGEILFTKIAADNNRMLNSNGRAEPTVLFKLPQVPPTPTKEQFLKNLGLEPANVEQKSIEPPPASQQEGASDNAKTTPSPESTVQTSTPLMPTAPPTPASTAATPTPMTQQFQGTNAFQAAGFAGFGVPSQMGSISGVAPQLGSLNTFQQGTTGASPMGGGFGAYAKGGNVFGALAQAHGSQQNAFSAMAQQQSSFGGGGGLMPQTSRFGVSGKEGNSKLFEMRK